MKRTRPTRRRYEYIAGCEIAPSEYPQPGNRHTIARFRLFEGLENAHMAMRAGRGGAANIPSAWRVYGATSAGISRTTPVSLPELIS